MANNENNTTIDIEAEAIKISTQANGLAKSAILQFLSELGINKIIYIDDRCSIQEHKEEFLAYLKSFYSTKPEEIDFVNWSSPRQRFDREITELWENSNDEIRRERFYQLLSIEGNDDNLQNSTAPLNIKKQLGNKIELLSPTEWEDQKDQIIQALNNENKVLFLFDIEFESAPLPSGRNGIDLTEELLNKEEVKDYIYCAVFSHLFTAKEEISERNKLHKDRGFDKKRFYTISKKRFTNDLYLPGLAEGIRNTLLVNEVELLKIESEQILSQSFKNSFKEIEKLDPESFNHIIVNSSYQEGTWEMLTLIRLKSIITQDNAFKTLLSENKRGKINTYLKDIRKIKDVETGGSTPFDKAQVQTLRKKELYIQENIINQLHFPISNGDIFKIKGKEYILISQPCNLAMRKTGRRDIMSGKVYDSGFLLQIHSVNKTKFNQYSSGQLATIGVLQNADLSSDKIKFVKFQLYKTVSLSPLDLSVFNTDGSATINLNKSEHESKTIQESWKLRYKQLHGEFASYRDQIRAFKKLRSSNKESLKNLVYYGEMFKGYKINNDNILNKNGNKLTIDIKRILHYKEPYSSDLLQQFMQYLSRNAFDRDFLND